MYSDENDGVSLSLGLNRPPSELRAGASRADWADLLHPYARTEGVFLCASTPSKRPSSAFGSDGGYALNFWYFAKLEEPQPTSIITLPAETILLLDGDGYYAAGGKDGPARDWFSHVRSRHMDTTNVGWVDGHARAMRVIAFEDDSRNIGFTGTGNNPSPLNPSRISYWDAD